MVGSAACAASFVLACSAPGAPPPHLVVSADAFGSASVFSAVDRTVTVTNDGGDTTGVVTIDVAGEQAAEFALPEPEPGECETGVTTLAAGQSCALTVRWTVGGLGARSTTLTASAAPGGSAQATLSGWGDPATITVVKSGTGTVTSVPAGIDCGTTCDASFDVDTVTLQARTTNGSGHHFSGWTGDACSGSSRDCVVSLAAHPSSSVTATFSPIAKNLVFLSSVPFAMNLGGAAAYDAKCNELATAAGINDVAGAAYVAWVSSSTSSAVTRLGTARGFVRMDGKPVGDQVSDLLLSAGNRILHAISLDENGVDPGNQRVVTGTVSDGSISGVTCSNYTSALSSDGYLFGDSKGGPRWWTHDNYIPCSNNARVYCFMKTRTEQLMPAVSAGKRIWVTNTVYVPGSAQSPDQKCAAEKPAGVSAARALIASTTTPASAALQPAQTYVRLDGQLLGTYDEVVAGADLRTGPWQYADGVYCSGAVWTGFNGALTNLAAASTTCLDWTSNASGQLGGTGLSGFASSVWGSASNNTSCTDPTIRLLCVEQ